MGDFLRIINVVIIIALIACIIGVKPWRKKTATRKQPGTEGLARLAEMQNRKQKLNEELRDYAAGVEAQTAELQQILDDYFAARETEVKALIKKEIDEALDGLEAESRAQMRQSFETAKTKLESGFDKKS